MLYDAYKKCNVCVCVCVFKVWTIHLLSRKMLQTVAGVAVPREAQIRRNLQHRWTGYIMCVCHCFNGNI